MRTFKIFSAICFALVLVSVAAPSNAIDMPDLAKKSGCTACHAIDRKVVGPAWMDVSKKYKGVKSISATLADKTVVKGTPKKVLITKVSKGGKGNWTAVTGGAAMPANAPRVAEADIAKLVDFILALAK